MEIYQIVGTPDQAGWSQIQHLAAKPDRPQAGEAVLLLAAPLSAKDGAVLGREIVARFSEKYFLVGRQSRLAVLKEALLAINQERPLYNSDQPPKLALAVLVERPPFVWMGVSGQAEIWLFRQGKLAPILASQPSQQVKVVSGRRQEGDLFVLASRQFFEILPQATITASLKNGDPRLAQEILSPLVYQQPGGRLAAAIIKLGPMVSAAAAETMAGLEPPAGGPPVPIKQGKSRPRFLALIPRIAKPAWRWPEFHFPGRPAIKLRPRRPAYSPQRQRWLRLLAAVFLVFLIVSVFSGWRRQQRERRLKAVAAKVSQAAELTNQARAVRRLDVDKSLALAKKAKGLVEEGLKIDPLNPALKQLNSQVDQLIAVSGGSQKLTPETFFDLRVIADDVQAGSWAFDGHYFWILDKSGRLIRLGKESKDSQLVSHDPILKDLQGIFFSGSQLYGWTPRGIFRLAGKMFKEAYRADLGPGLWAGWGGNVYQVATAKKQILKYPAGSGKLLAPQPWLKSKMKIDGQATGFDINGSLWLLGSQGQVWRFYAGRQQSFPRQPSLEKSSLLTVMAAKPYLAFWAGQKKMVVVLDKKGQLVMRAPLNIDNLRGLALADGGKKIFLLTPTAVKVLSLSW